MLIVILVFFATFINMLYSSLPHLFFCFTHVFSFILFFSLFLLF